MSETTETALRVLGERADPAGGDGGGAGGGVMGGATGLRDAIRAYTSAIHDTYDQEASAPSVAAMRDAKAAAMALVERAERIEQAARAHVAAVETPGGPVAPTYRALKAAVAEGDETR